MPTFTLNLYLSADAELQKKKNLKLLQIKAAKLPKQV